MGFRHGSGNPCLQKDTSHWSGRAAWGYLIAHVAWAASHVRMCSCRGRTALRALARGMGSGLGKEGGQSQANSRLQSQRDTGSWALGVPPILDSVHDETIGALVQIV